MQRRTRTSQIGRTVASFEGTHNFSARVSDLNVWKSTPRGRSFASARSAAASSRPVLHQHQTRESDGALVGRGYRRPRNLVLGKLRLPDRRGQRLRHTAHGGRDARFSDWCFRVTQHEDPVVPHLGLALRTRGVGDLLSRPRQRGLRWVCRHGGRHATPPLPEPRSLELQRGSGHTNKAIDMAEFRSTRSRVLSGGSSQRVKQVNRCAVEGRAEGRTAPGHVKGRIKPGREEGLVWHSPTTRFRHEEGLGEGGEWQEEGRR